MKKSKGKMKQVCEKCGSPNLKNPIATYPVKVGEKQINVGRVAVRECLDCHWFMPTPTGQSKIDRLLGTFFHIFQ